MNSISELDSEDNEARMKSSSDTTDSSLNDSNSSSKTVATSPSRHETDKATQNSCQCVDPNEKNINFEGDIEANKTKIHKNEDEKVLLRRDVEIKVTNYDGKVFKIFKEGNHEEISSGSKVLHFVDFNSIIEVVTVLEVLNLENFHNLLVIVLDIKLESDQNLSNCKFLNNLLHKFRKFDDIVVELNIQGEDSPRVRSSSLRVRTSEIPKKIKLQSHSEVNLSLSDSHSKFVFVKSREIASSNGSFICINEVQIDHEFDEIDSKSSKTNEEVLKHSDDILHNDPLLANFDGGGSQIKKPQFNLKLFLSALICSKISFLDDDLVELTTSIDSSIKNLLKLLIKGNNSFTIALMNLFNLYLTSIDIIELLAFTTLSDNKKIPKIVFELHYTRKIYSMRSDGELVVTPQLFNTLTKKRESRRSMTRDSHDGFKIDLFVKQTFPKVNINEENVHQLKILMESLDRESDREKCLTFIVEENHFKFLKIFLKFFNKFKFELWNKIMKKARNLEFFGIIKELLDEVLINDYKSDHEKVAIMGFQSILRDVEEFFENIKDRNIPKIKNFVKLHPTMKSVYLKDLSALEFSLECKLFEIYAFLKVNQFRGHNLQYKISKLKDSEKREIRDEILSVVTNYKETYILTILTKCRYATSLSSFDSDTKEMLDILKEIREVKPMLIIISKVDIEIVFDFSNESVNGIDPTVDEGTRGLTYFIKNQILIGKDSGKNARYENYFQNVFNPVFSLLGMEHSLMRPLTASCTTFMKINAFHTASKINEGRKSSIKSLKLRRKSMKLIRKTWMK